mmetsp:Transcript_7620/g.18142  ORF Transcript_7620/g.18142 Transcript_7620/m.18142 type:complete len:110 (-) Transcript_7620:390-719(-)
MRSVYTLSSTVRRSEMMTTEGTGEQAAEHLNRANEPRRPVPRPTSMAKTSHMARCIAHGTIIQKGTGIEHVARTRAKRANMRLHGVCSTAAVGLVASALVSAATSFAGR